MAERYRGGSAPRPGLSDEQRRAIQLWIWGDEDKRDKKTGLPHYFRTYSELARAVGVNPSQITRWFRDFPLFIEEMERQQEIRDREDDKFYTRLRRKAQKTLEKNLDAPYARDSTAAALAILGRCGDVDGVRVEVQSLDADKVIRGGFGRSKGDA